MLANFPIPRHDETLHSVIARFLDLWPRRMHWRALEYLLGRKRRAIAVDLPHGIAALCSRLPPESRLTPHIVLRQHTFLPFIQPFTHSDLLGKVIDAMLSDGHPHMLLGVGPGGPLVHRNLHLCALCAKEDIDAIGVPTWRRIHQLGFVHICPTHQCWLLETECISSSSGFRISAARTAVIRNQPTWGDTAQTLLTRLAQNAKTLAEYNIPPFGEKILSNIYYHRLKILGFTKPNGRVRHTELMLALESAWPNDALNAVGCELSAARDNWVRRIAGHTPSHQSPIRHLLMSDALGLELKGQIDVKRFKNRAKILAARSKRLVSSSYIISPIQKNRSADRWAALDQTLFRRITEFIQANADSTRRMSLNSLAIASGRPALVHSKHLKIPQTNSLVFKNTESTEQHAIKRIQRVRENLSDLSAATPAWRVAQLAGIGAEMRRNSKVQFALQKI